MVLYRAGWPIERLFEPWKSHNLPASPPTGAATPERSMAEVWARRSLCKAPRAIRDRAVLPIEALADPVRLREAPGRIGVGLAAAARITPRDKHPGSFQLLADLELLDWGP